MRIKKKVKGTVYILTCFSAIFIGGAQYSRADNVKKKESKVQRNIKATSIEKKFFAALPTKVLLRTLVIEISSPIKKGRNHQAPESVFG